MSLSNYIRRTKGEDREDINRLLGVMSDIFYPEPEEGSVQERIVLADERRIRTLSVADAILDVTSTDTRNRYAVEAPTLQMPTACESYSLIHSTTGTLTYEKTTGTKYGGGAIFNGTTDYVYIADDSLLDYTTASSFSIATFFKSSTGNRSIISKRATLDQEGYDLRINTDGTLRFAIEDTANAVMFVDSSGVENDGVWHSTIAVYDGTNNSTGMDMYVDGVDVSSNRTGDTLGTITNNISLDFGAQNGAQFFTGTLAWSMLLAEAVNATWATGYNGGFFDWSGGNLVTSIPFVGDESVWSEATTPFCVSS